MLMPARVVAPLLPGEGLEAVEVEDEDGIEFLAESILIDGDV